MACGLGQLEAQDEDQAPEPSVSLHSSKSCLAKTSLVLQGVLSLMNQHFPAEKVAFAISQQVLIESIQKKQTNKGSAQTMAEGRK